MEKLEQRSCRILPSAGALNPETQEMLVCKVDTTWLFSSPEISNT
jgi:hypothetical protein